MEAEREVIQERKMVSLSKDNIDWFERTYGKAASLSWALDLCFQKFRDAHTHTPEEYAKIGAEMAVADIEGEVDSQ